MEPKIFVDTANSIGPMTLFRIGVYLDHQKQDQCFEISQHKICYGNKALHKYTSMREWDFEFYFINGFHLSQERI